MRKILLAACAVLALTGAALGETKEYAKVGDWRMVSSEQHCSAVGGYNNGTTLAFGVNTDGDAWMVVSSEKWKIPAGTYTVPAWIDSFEMEDMKFKVNEDGRLMVLNLEMNETIYNLFTKGKEMTLKIGSVVHRYFLKDTAVMFPSLLGCVRDIAKAANPFSQPAAPVSSPSNPFRPL